MRFLLLLVSFLLLAGTLSAEPPSKPWYKDWKVWAVIGTSIASSAVATKEAHDCRMRPNAGISFCQGGYGEFKARESVRMGTSLLLDGIGIWGRHEGYKEWPSFALGFTGYNTYVAAQQAGIGCKAGTWPVWGTKYNCVTWTWRNYDSQKPDLSRIVIVHR